MEKLMKSLHEVFNEVGITNPGYRIKLVSREIIGKSDWAYVGVDIYAPRKKKPCQYRKLAINFVRNIIDLNKSEYFDY